MLLTILILFLFFLGIYSGFRRGLILQLVLTIGYVISFWMALRYYEWLSDIVEMLVPYPNPTSSTNPFVLYGQELLFEMDGAFYNGIAFVGLLFIGWLLTRFVGGLVSFLADIPVVRQVNMIGGAIVGFLVQYIGIFFILFLLSTIPLDMIQNQFESSRLAQFMVTETPQLSGEVYEWWVERGLDE
jgi:uncharacterized membrane protein required for colicin V production